MRVFVSGALNSDSIGFLRNVRKMLLLGHEVRALGVRVYVPINDILMDLVGGCQSCHEDYYNIDLEELKNCDAMILVPGYEESKGVKGEMEFAAKNDIPIFETFEGLKKFLEYER